MLSLLPRRLARAPLILRALYSSNVAAASSPAPNMSALRQAVFVDVAEASPREWVSALRHSNNSSSNAQSMAAVSLAADPYAQVAKELVELSDNVRLLVDVDHPVMRVAASYYFSLQGKRMRPMMVLLMAKAVNEHLAATHPHLFATSASSSGLGVISASQKKLAEITEMIHVASLAHDDVIDESGTRRGAPSLNALYGNKVSILAGDFLLGRASLALARLHNTEVVELLSKVIEHLALGEVIQMTGVLPDSPPDDELADVVKELMSGTSVHTSAEETVELSRFITGYMHKTYLKTASLVANSCKAAVLLSDGAQDPTLAAEVAKLAEAAHSFGRHVGLTYQFVDDSLDVTSDAATVGKPAAFADLRQGTVTAPVLLAARYTPSLLPLIRRHFSHQGDIDQGLNAVSDSFARGVNDTVQLATWHTEKAAEALLLSFRPSGARDALVNLVRNISRRKR